MVRIFADEGRLVIPRLENNKAVDKTDGSAYLQIGS